MDRTDILHLYDEQERQHGTHPSYRREAVEGVVRHINDGPTRLSFIVYSDLTADNADRIIADQVAWYHQQVNGAGLEWNVFDHDRPADLPERLAAHGFIPGERAGILVLDVQNPPAAFQPLTTAGTEELAARGVEIRRITNPDLFREVANIQATVYGANFDWLANQLRENVSAQPDFWAIFMVYVEELPVCAAWISFPPCSQFAGLFGGATRPEYRRQGLYTALVAARAQEALRRGRRFLTVDANNMSRPILVKRGFELLTYYTPFLWKK